MKMKQYRMLKTDYGIDQESKFRIKKLGEDSDKFFKAQIDNIKQLFKDYVPPDKCVELKGFPQINELISDGNAVEYQLIYQGTKHGLSGKGYWNQCDGKADLLTIFVSQNGHIFGGYSPCQVLSLRIAICQIKLQYHFYSYIEQIFKLKQQNAKLAIFCNSSKKPTFGHYDLEIESDFNKGSSNLGQCYDISNYNIADPKTHLFGDIKPQIKECKVYKVIFK